MPQVQEPTVPAVPFLCRPWSWIFSGPKDLSPTAGNIKGFCNSNGRNIVANSSPLVSVGLGTFVFGLISGLIAYAAGSASKWLFGAVSVIGASLAGVGGYFVNKFFNNYASSSEGHSIEARGLENEVAPKKDSNVFSVRGLVALLENPKNEEKRLAAADALLSYKECPELAEELFDCLCNATNDEFSRFAAILILVGRDDKTILKSLISCLTNNKVNIFSRTMAALVLMNKRDSKVIRALKDCLHSESSDDYARHMALHALAQIGTEEAKAAIGEITDVSIPDELLERRDTALHEIDECRDKWSNLCIATNTNPPRFVLLEKRAA